MTITAIKGIKVWFFIWLGILLLTSCNNENAFDCTKSSGRNVEKEVITERIHSIEVNDDVDLFIATGNEQKIVLKTGENIASKILFSINNGILSVSNTNFCNWTRKSNNVKVYITLDSLVSIKQFGFGTIQSIDTLIADHLYLESKIGPGDFNLQVKLRELTVVSNSTSNFDIIGTTESLFVGFFSNDGKFNGQNLITENATVIHDGTNAIAISPHQYVSVEIKSFGNLELFKRPETIESTITGKGKIIIFP